MIWRSGAVHPELCGLRYMLTPNMGNRPDQFPTRNSVAQRFAGTAIVALI